MGFANIPILAKAAAQVAASCAKGKDAGAWKEMIERLFFHRIDAKTAAASISGEDKPVIDALAYKTESALALMKFA